MAGRRDGLAACCTAVWPPGRSSSRYSSPRALSGRGTARRAILSARWRGPRGQVQTANFAVTGTLVLAGAAGLRHAADPALSSRAGRALIGAAGAGLIAAAVFATDPVSGYPPGTPGALTQPTRAGMIHNLAAVPVFLGLPAAAITCSRQSIRAGHRGFGLYCAATATTMLATTALAGAGFNQSPRLVNLAGLFQRASIVTGFGWLTTISARALTRASATPARKRST